METRYRLLSLGIDANLRHYGLVDWYDSHIWTNTQQNGKGRIRAYIPYAKGKKWRAVDFFSADIEDRHKALKRGDLVGFYIGTGSTGLKARNILFLRADQTEIDIERTVTKEFNQIRADGYVSPVTCDELDFFGSHLTLDMPTEIITTEKPLPQIQKAPKVNE